LTTLLTGGSAGTREALDDDVDLARDRVLVTRAQAGDRSAFDDLYVRYYRRLHRFCLRRLHDGYEAEDVAQEAFARAWRALPTFAGDRRFYPWLSVIAAHLCTDVLRRRNRSTPVAEFHQANVASTEDDGEQLMVAAVDSELVARAFQRLSDRHQRILNLREGSGWSYQKIADHEGVGITAVETLLWRARQALKREFAALAGSEGRIAAWIGAFLSLAALRRILRAPMHAAKRTVHLVNAAPALAVGSAVAATAVVVVAAIGAPFAAISGQAPASAAGPGSSGPGANSSSGYAAARSSGASGDGANSDVASLGDAGSASRAGAAAVTSHGSHGGVTSTAGNSIGGAALGRDLGTGESAVGGASGALGGVSNAVSGSLGGVSDELGNVSGTLGGAVGGVGDTISGLSQGLTGVLTGSGGGLDILPPVGTVLGAGGSSSSIPPVVSSVTQQAGAAAGAASGAVSSTVSGTASSTGNAATGAVTAVGAGVSKASGSACTTLLVTVSC
jgi:RNA polymerase sigma-70 factor, ECF subfamily